MIYNELTFNDEIRIKQYRKKWRLFIFIPRLFCMHFFKRNGIFPGHDIWTCCKCGKDYYKEVTSESPPINYIE